MHKHAAMGQVGLADSPVEAVAVVIERRVLRMIPSDAPGAVFRLFCSPPETSAAQSGCQPRRCRRSPDSMVLMESGFGPGWQKMQRSSFW